ncbi:MAG TPA: hypothetical protein VKY90_11840 [Candidatus Dormibacteraeota bacterium]|nr:hypothetical protein [Candidatus Dormibacteraeota bacterium]
MIRSHDDVQPLYRVMLVLGAAGLLILALGLTVFLRFAPLGQRTGLVAHVVGVYAYDPSRREVWGPPATRFPRTRPFAARVSWASLPSQVVVGATWYDSLQEPTGGVGPAPAGRLAASNGLVPEHAPSGLRGNLPGTYTLLVLRYVGGQPVEILARTTVIVERSP